MIAKSHRWQKTAVAAAAIALLGLSTPGAWALSLGRITVQSALGEPLRAEIEVPDINAEEAASLKAGVASPSITPEAITFLQDQSWPGNVRELKNTVRKALLLARDYTISLEHVKEIVATAREPVAASQETITGYISGLLDQVERGEIRHAFPKMLSDLERELYSQAIQRTHGNITKAAEWLGITRLKMREKLREFGLHPNQTPESE